MRWRPRAQSRVLRVSRFGRSYAGVTPSDVTKMGRLRKRVLRRYREECTTPAG